MRSKNEYVAKGELAKTILNDLKREPTEKEIERVMKAQRNQLKRREPTKKQSR